MILTSLFNTHIPSLRNYSNFYVVCAFFCFFLWCVGFANAQAQLVLNDGGWLVMNNGIYLVVDNGNANAITQIGTKGYVHSEGENNRIKWNIGTNSGTYVFPFKRAGQTDENTFWMNITTPGSGAGSFTVSSWYTAANSVPPSGGYTVCPDENNATDRFWVISPSDYTDKPIATIRFYYNSNELDGIPEANLQMQRGNISLSCPWELPVGTVDVTNNYVEASLISNFSPWVLVNRASPLPVTLLSFTGKCTDDKVVLLWETIVEINNSHFTIQRGYNALDFESIGTVQGAGNSNGYISYEYADFIGNKGNNATVYYRLVQTDFDGNNTYYATIIAQNCNTLTENNISILIKNKNDLLVSAKTYRAKGYDLFIYDVLGRKVQQETIIMNHENNVHIFNLKNLSAGIYFITFQNEEEIITTKLYIP